MAVKLNNSVVGVVAAVGAGGWTLGGGAAEIILC